jgi:uncharacterized OsmC-like protein/alpha-beta hydrolase superfamily lysophospholipase
MPLRPSREAMMASQPFEFTGAQGQRLVGRMGRPEGPVHAFALFAHCFTCTMNSVAAVRIARALTLRGIGVLRFDFTGLGRSGGSFADSSFSGSVQDVLAAAQAMAAAGAAPGLLVGHSLGGAAVLAAAADLPQVRAVATIAAPFDVQHVAGLLKDGLEALERDGQAEVQIGGRPFLLRRGFVDDLRRHDQGERIAGLRRALLVLHGPRDATVGIDNASSIFQAARHPKSFVSLDDADHLLTRQADAEYAADVIAAWASRYLQVQAPLRAGGDTGQVVVQDTGQGGFQVEVLAGGARFLADEPPEVGGLGSGPTPYDLVSAGLGACTAMTLKMYARRKGWPLERVRVSVGHARDAGAAPPDRFVRELAMEGNLDAQQRARLLEIADRCPVHLTLERGARVETHQAGMAGQEGGEPADPPGRIEPADRPGRIEHADQHGRDMQAGLDMEASPGPAAL